MGRSISGDQLIHFRGNMATALRSMAATAAVWRTRRSVWAGELEFAVVGKRQVQRTGQETTQRSGEA